MLYIFDLSHCTGLLDHFANKRSTLLSANLTKNMHAVITTSCLNAIDLKIRLTTLVNASRNPISDVSCRDIDAKIRPPRNSSAKMST